MVLNVLYSFIFYKPRPTFANFNLKNTLQAKDLLKVKFLNEQGKAQTSENVDCAVILHGPFDLVWLALNTCISHNE